MTHPMQPWIDPVLYPKITYLDAGMAIGARNSEAPRHRSASGYGSKIPTSLEVQLTDKRWRRVYCVCWSNAGTAYVVYQGRPHYLSHHYAGHLQDMANGRSK